VSVQAAREAATDSGQDETVQALAGISDEKVETFLSFAYTTIIGPLLKNTKITCAQQTKLYTSIYHLTQTRKYKSSLKKLFDVPLLSVHFRIGRRLFTYVCMVTEKNHIQDIDSTSSRQSDALVKELQEHGASAAKLRYVAGYVVAKLKYRAKKLVEHHLHNVNSAPVRNTLFRISLLEGMCGDSDVAGTSKYPDTLLEIEERKYGNLVYLSDEAYEFFHKIELSRIQLLSLEGLAKHGSCLPGQAVSLMMQDKDIGHLFTTLTLGCDSSSVRKEPRLDDADTSRKATKRFLKSVLSAVSVRAEVICTLKRDVIALYMRAGSKAFKQLVYRELAIKKQEAHRVKITKRKAKTTTQKKKKQARVMTETCAFCDHLLDNTDIAWIQCDGCDSWVCRPCAGLLLDCEWEAAQSESADFICKNCSPLQH